MDVIERQEDSTRNNSNKVSRQAFKFQQRKINIGRVIWSKRTPHQSIKGYNLSKYNKKRKFQIKRCWTCGSTNHLIADCPVHRETQLRKRVSELEDRVQELEAALLNQINNRKK